MFAVVFEKAAPANRVGEKPPGVAPTGPTRESGTRDRLPWLPRREVVPARRSSGSGGAVDRAAPMSAAAPRPSATKGTTSPVTDPEAGQSCERNPHHTDSAHLLGRRRNSSLRSGSRRHEATAYRPRSHPPCDEGACARRHPDRSRAAPDRAAPRDGSTGIATTTSPLRMPGAIESLATVVGCHAHSAGNAAQKTKAAATIRVVLESVERRSRDQARIAEASSRARPNIGSPSHRCSALSGPFTARAYRA